MEQDNDLAAYCARVLGRLNMTTSRSLRSTSGVIHVFVNERRVGTLNEREAESSLQFQRQGCVDHIHLRSEEGTLIGSLSAPEYGFRATRLPLSEGTVELRIRNTAEGGSASAMFTPAPRRWSGLLRNMAESVQTMALRPVTGGTARGMRMVVVLQVLLAVVVLGLAADRMISRMTPDGVPQVAMQTEVANLEQQLSDLTRMQAKAVESIQSQQEGMVRLQLEIAKLSSSQRMIGASMQAARQTVGHVEEGGGQHVAESSDVVMSHASTDQSQLKDEIRDLTVENARLSKEMAELAEQNQDLEKMLKSARPEVSKATVTDQNNSMLTQQPDHEPVTSMSPRAEVRDDTQPLLFWVNFSEGTTQESIDQWVHDVQGHMGAVNGGWQEVAVTQPSMPTDRFLEQVRGAKIVKAVRVDP